MSQKSLKNNVKLNDFKRSLTGSILFPAIALVVFMITMTIPVISYVTSDEFLSTKEHFEISMFLSPTSIFTELAMLFPIGMVLCGILTAVKSFYYMLSKKQVNVYFSMGITRTTMFCNRVLAGVIALFAAVLIPMAIICMVNISCFGYAAQALKVFCYAVSLFFTCGLAGFALGAAATMISGNVFEAGLTTIAASAVPAIFVSTAESLLISFLKGYTSIGFESKWYSLISPWHISKNFSDAQIVTNYGYSSNVSFENVLGLIARDVPADRYKIPEALQINIDFYISIIAWLVLSAVILFVGLMLYKARKAEHANSFGNFAISRAVTTTFIFGVIAYYADDLSYGQISPLAFFAILAVVEFVVYFLIQLLMTRKLKTTLKSLKWYGALMGIVAVFLIVAGTGLFGIFNKTPDKAEVKSVSIEARVISPYEHYISSQYNGEEDFVESETAESIDMVVSLFDKIKKEKVLYGKDPITTVTFVFRDKDNNLKYRDFGIYSDELFNEYMKAVYNSDFFDMILKEYLITDPKETPEDSDFDMGGISYYFGDINNSAGYLKRDWAFISNTNLCAVDKDWVPQVEFVEDIDALCTALYNDLSKLSYEQLALNKSKPVGILASGSVGYLGEEPASTTTVIYSLGGISNSTEQGYRLADICIPVYPEMSETVAFLKNNGYADAIAEFTVKEVLYSDSPLNIEDALIRFYEANDNSKIYRSYWSYDRNKLQFTSSEFTQYVFNEAGWYIGENMALVDVLKKVYNDAGHPLTAVTDTAKANAIVDKSVSQYMVHGDNGRYVYVIYEEGPVVCYYLPEASVSVLK